LDAVEGAGGAGGGVCEDGFAVGFGDGWIGDLEPWSGGAGLIVRGRACGGGKLRGRGRRS
jgi:hypothetical protein